MSHSVQKHLSVDPVAYDAEIRRFVPGYETMLDEVTGALAEHLPPGAGPILDLGAGTGGLSARIAAARADARFILLDADPTMLEQAKVRLGADGARFEFRRGLFQDALPSCAAAVASLSLHHIPLPAQKREVYRNILGALKPGGVLVSADTCVPAAADLVEPLMRRWAAHLVQHGDTEAQAYGRFAAWAKEDHYLSIEQELALLREAGFQQVDVRWRLGPSTVLVARHP